MRTEGQLLAQIIHGFYLDDRTQIYISCSTTGPGDPHLEYLGEFVQILRESGFLVRLDYETPRTSVDRVFRRTYRIRKPRQAVLQKLASAPVIDVGPGLSLAVAVLKMYLLASIERVDNLQIKVPAAEGWTHAARWIGEFSRAIGLDTVRHEIADRALTLDLSRRPYFSVGWPMDEFVSYREWTALAYYLFKTMTRGLECDNCGNPFRENHEPYEVAWLAVEKGGDPGQLILTEGFGPSELKSLRSQVGGEILASLEKEGVIFVPAKAWDGRPQLLVSKPSKDLMREFDILARIPPPPGVGGIRKGPRLDEEVEEDTIPVTLLPLGGGQEIGANSYLLQIGSRRILLDCGLDIRKDSANPMGLPAIELIDNLDAIILTHAHTDHIGSVLMVHSLFPNVPIFCTPETSILMRVMLAHHTSWHFRKKMEAEKGFEVPALAYWDETFNQMLWELPDDEKVALPGLGGVILRFVPAGHILGAAAVELNLGDRKILYTGDFCLRDQLTVRGSRIVEGGTWDTLIIESTYGAQTDSEVLDAQRATEKLCALIGPTIDRNGTVLLPAFAIGKSQELFAMLIRGIERGLLPGLSHDQILIGGLANPFFDVYGDYVEDKELRKYIQAASSHNAMPRDVTIEQADPKEPTVYIATHGMMIPGTKSFDLANELLEKDYACIVVTGYQALNSPGRLILEASRAPHSRREIRFAGKRTRIEATLGSARISGHATFEELMKTVQLVSPQRLIVVHGNPDRVRNLILNVAKAHPEIQCTGPVNGQRIDLGVVRFGEDDVEEWQKYVRAEIPEISADIPLRASDDRLDWTGFYFRSNNTEVKKAKGEDRVYEALLNPRAYPKASILLEAQLPISSLERITVKRLYVESEKVVDRDHDSLSEFRSYKFRLELGPGDYLIESAFGGKEVAQRLRILLDMEESAEDWSFDKDGKLHRALSVLPVHLQHFESATLRRKDQTEVDASISTTVSPGHIHLHIQKHHDQRGLALLRFSFRDSVLAKPVGIHLGEEETVPEDVVFEHHGASLLPGSVARIVVLQQGSVLRKVSVVSGPGEMPILTASLRKWAITFTDPGQYVLDVQIIRETGHVRDFRQEVEVVPSAFLTSPLPDTLIPAHKYPVELQLQQGDIWSDLELSVGGKTIAHERDGEKILASIIPSSDLADQHLRLTGKSTITPEITVALFTRTFRIGLGIEVDEKKSFLILDETREAQVWLRSRGTASRSQLKALMESVDDKILVFDHENSEEGVYRFKINNSLWDSLESAPTWISTGIPGIDLLNRNGLKVELKAGRESLANGSILRGGKSVIISISPNEIGTRTQGSGTSLVCVKVTPLLQWIELRRFEGGREVVLEGPGEYKVMILHFGRVAIEQGFEVAPREQWDPTTAKPAATHEGRSYTSLNDLEKAVGDFMGRNQNTPPSLIGFSRRDRLAIFNGPRESMTATLAGLLSGHLNEVTVFVVPSNSVPSYLSRALFSLDERWLALSYPCPRDLQSVSAPQFAQTVLKSPRDFSASIRQIRRVDRGQAGNWEPSMLITCPDCGKPLRADLTQKPPITKCDCGFESTHVGYSLKELRSGEFNLLVLQQKLYSYAVENLEKELNGAPPQYTFMAGLEILQRAAEDPFEYGGSQFPSAFFPGVAHNLDPEMTVISLINGAYRLSVPFVSEAG